MKPELFLEQINRRISEGVRKLLNQRGVSLMPHLEKIEIYHNEDIHGDGYFQQSKRTSYLFDYQVALAVFNQFGNQAEVEVDAPTIRLINEGWEDTTYSCREERYDETLTEGILSGTLRINNSTLDTSILTFTQTGIEESYNASPDSEAADRRMKIILELEGRKTRLGAITA